jgi:hypothetical protein
LITFVHFQKKEIHHPSPDGVIAWGFNYRIASRMKAGKDAVKEVSMAKNFTR